MIGTLDLMDSTRKKTRCGFEHSMKWGPELVEMWTLDTPCVPKDSSLVFFRAPFWVLAAPQMREKGEIIRNGTDSNASRDLGPPKPRAETLIGINSWCDDSILLQCFHDYKVVPPPHSNPAKGHPYLCRFMKSSGPVGSLIAIYGPHAREWGSWDAS